MQTLFEFAWWVGLGGVCTFGPRPVPEFPEPMCTLHGMALGRIVDMKTAVAVLVACLAVASVAPTQGATQSVADIVSTNSQLTTLTALLSKAGLVSALSGSGPFSVFGAWALSL